MQYIKSISIWILLLIWLSLSSTSFAIVDPFASSNNKFGIHIISAVPEETNPARELVNSNGGDWGYITVLIESKDRNKDKWQKFFDELRRQHLIPIVRLATQPESGYWKKPYEGEEIAWADFLNDLNWPTKNRYVVIYNEPNHGQEWNSVADPRSYAQVLNKTIDALKNKNPDFFVMNAGFDLSTPQQPPNYLDQLYFMQQMNEEVPGIFTKLDGWSSHAYPNPGFVGSPNATGRISIRGYLWELEQLRHLGVTKRLPVFITETGWKHSDGKVVNKSLPSPETVADYFENAFTNAWASDLVVAVTPFLLNYQDRPFDHFSFKKQTGEIQSQKILGVEFPEYHQQYYALVNMKKSAGRPVQEEKAELISGEIYKTLVFSQQYQIKFRFKNTGQSIWNEYESVQLKILESEKELQMTSTSLPRKVEPGQEGEFIISLKAPSTGNYKAKLQLQRGDISLTQPLEYSGEVKSPVILVIKSALGWKDDESGDYLLEIDSGASTTRIPISLNSKGESEELEARYLLPEYKFIFTLNRQYYYPKTIEYTLKSGVNYLEFGELKPNLLEALLNPQQFWKLLPFSN